MAQVRLWKHTYRTSHISRDFIFFILSLLYFKCVLLYPVSRIYSLLVLSGKSCILWFSKYFLGCSSVLISRSGFQIAEHSRTGSMLTSCIFCHHSVSVFVTGMCCGLQKLQTVFCRVNWTFHISMRGSLSLYPKWSQGKSISVVILCLVKWK